MVLLSAQDLVPLAKKNLGLRLTRNLREDKCGGFGDAVPLSHLAGANDIIAFITLSFLPQLPREKMNAIYNRYKQSHIHSTECMPRSILYYAAQHHINDARERLSVAENYSTLNISAIESEAKHLVSFYNATSMIYPLKLVVKNLPHLAQELAYNFNEKLQLRLKVNWNCYATSDEMNYLFLTSDVPGDQIHQDGYDFNHYPLGKTGSRQFYASNVVEKLMFLGGKNRTMDAEKNLEEHIFNSIKTILHNELQASLRQLQRSIAVKLSQHLNYPVDFKHACNRMVTLVARLQENGQLLSEEAIDLMRMTESLVENPAQYKVFLAEAKHYRMVDGGRLTAYMMLIAGWAAKIMTFNHIGDAWIQLANDKFDYLATTEACADASEAYSKSMGL